MTAAGSATGTGSYVLAPAYSNSTITYSYPGALTSYAGDKPLVVCAGKITEVEDMATAKEKAGELAHQNNAEAFILKPVRKVRAKRQVIVTELR